MKVLLVRPPRPKEQIFHVVPPIGLGYLARAVRKENAQVAILDGIREKLDWKTLEERLEREGPDVLGITFFSHNFSAVRRISSIAKRISPELVVATGGPHPSVLPQETLIQLPHLDVAFTGEGEDSFLAFLSLLATDGRLKTETLSQIAGIAWRVDNEIRVAKGRYEQNIDRFGMPAWDLMDPRLYPALPHGGISKRFPIAPIITSRGCPYPCAFCAASTISGKRVRYRSVGLVMQEIDLLVKEHKVREIQILDDSFTSEKEYVLALCESISSRKHDISISCPNGVRANTLDDEVLAAMRKAGWYSIIIGIESGSQRILDRMKKHLSLEEIAQKVRLIKNHGLEAGGFFMVGYPGETRGDMERTISFAMELDLDWAFFGTFVPLPGTEIYQELRKSGRLGSIDWDSTFVGATIAHSLSEVDAAELESAVRKAHIRFYFHPRRLTKLLTRARPANIRAFYKRAMFALRGHA